MNILNGRTLITAAALIAAVTAALLFVACSSTSEHVAESRRADARPASAPVSQGNAEPSLYESFGAWESEPQFSRQLMERRRRAPRAAARPITRTTLVPGEELWIIPTSESRPTAAPRGDLPPMPRCGSLVAFNPGAEDTPFAELDFDKDVVPIPLAYTDVDASIAGYIATVGVTQQYHNPFSRKIEAVYVFPLPTDAAVNEFVMQIGDRRIRGIVREKEEAERIYYEARSRGHVASLMTQQRPNIFTQRVANIEPGRRIDVSIRYFHALTYDQGVFEWVFPMVVGPRFNPSGAQDPIHATARGTHARAPSQGANVNYLHPDERSGHDVGLRVSIDAGVPIRSVESATHVVDVARVDSNRMDVELRELDSIPNRDFVLRYRVSGEDVQPGLVTHVDERGGYFATMLFPPNELPRSRQPLELVFVVDTSGSMKGKPIMQAKDALTRAVSRLRPDDTFQIIRFSNDASTFGPRPVSPTRENVAKARTFIRGLSAGGGTHMREGVRKALDFPHDPERYRFVCFLTDGYIGNEGEVLGEVDDRLGSSRIFSFGIGSSTNRYLLEEMARLGRGVVAHVGSGDEADEVMDAFFERVERPWLTDIDLRVYGARVSDVYPRRVPDLFAGRPVVVTGRFDPASVDGAGMSVEITGRMGARDVRYTAAADGGRGGMHDGLAAMWARKRIAALSRDAIRRGHDPSHAIKATALNYGLLSAYTSFVAVDASRRTSGDSGRTVNVPVNMPEGVDYGTTVR